MVKAGLKGWAKRYVYVLPKIEVQGCLCLYVCSVFEPLSECLAKH